VAAKYVTMRDLKFVRRSRETCFTRYMTIKVIYVETAFNLSVSSLQTITVISSYIDRALPNSSVRDWPIVESTSFDESYS